jgi:hypothetical protein
MATWSRTRSHPLTVESQVEVTDGQRTGLASVVWEGGKAVLRGPVLQETGGVVDDPLEAGYRGPRPVMRVLDANPTYL